MIRLVRAGEAETAIEDLPMGTVVVVCDPDAERAATVARRVVGYRTAIFVGDLSVEADRQAACEFAAATFSKDGAVVLS